MIVESERMTPGPTFMGAAIYFPDEVPSREAQ